MSIIQARRVAKTLPATFDEIVDQLGDVAAEGLRILIENNCAEQFRHYFVAGPRPIEDLAIDLAPEVEVVSIEPTTQAVIRSTTTMDEALENGLVAYKDVRSCDFEIECSEGVCTVKANTDKAVSWSEQNASGYSASAKSFTFDAKYLQSVVARLGGEGFIVTEGSGSE